MAMGHNPVCVITVEKEDIIKQNFTSLIKLEELLVEHDETIDTFAQIIEYVELNYGIATELSCNALQDVGDEFGINRSVLRHGLTLYRHFQLDFNEKYELNIALGYHDKKERGDIYDDVSGGYFVIDFGDVYEVTEQAKNMQKDIPFEISQFVVFS